MGLDEPVIVRGRWVLPIGSEPLRDAEVVIEGERITEIRPATGEVPPHVVTPGLVNAHAHLQYGPSFADLADGDLPFARWIAQMIQRRAATSHEGWRAETAASWRLARAAGTTAVSDVVSNTAALDVDVPGVRFVESVGVHSPDWPAERTRLLAALEGHPDAAPAPHTLYTLGTDVVRGIAELGRERDLRLHLHLAETADETEFVRSGSGPLAALPFSAEMELVRQGGAGLSPARYLDEIFGLGPDLHVAHGVHLDADDRALLRAKGTSVALCARSNAILQAGEPPIAAHLEEGTLFCVGTDSLASSPSLDLLDELRALGALARRQGYDRDDLARRLLEAATIGGARAIGRAAGVLAPGARADVAVFAVDDPDGPDPYESVVRSGRCVQTLVAGTNGDGRDDG
ncbi:MAG TPA: amidohydrolase family protein [Frankiaceae bacterium]|nr:amidohydrolase family protein [Frankiaceae bacterium]